MKAIVNDRYGSPDVMELRDIDRPTLTEDGVLVCVRASSVNALDWHTLRGKPYVARLDAGLRRPKARVLGADAAGVVEAVGANVTHVKLGDEVFGSCLGSFAEYVNGRQFVTKPAALTFEEAAAIPTAGLTALQGLRDKGAIRPGQHVLINGAGGGVGTFAVQIAKAFGAEVTAATRADNADVVRSLGADHFIDHTTQAIARGQERYDLILDVAGTQSMRSLRRALAPNGTIVIVAPGPGQWIGPITRILGAVISSRFSAQQTRPFLAGVNRDDLVVLKDLVEAGKVRPVIDRTYPLEAVPDAVRYVEAGGVRGKVAITVSAAP